MGFFVGDLDSLTNFHLFDLFGSWNSIAMIQRISDMVVVIYSCPYVSCALSNLCNNGLGHDRVVFNVFPLNMIDCNFEHDIDNMLLIACGGSRKFRGEEKAE